MTNQTINQLNPENLHELFLKAYKAVSQTDFKFKQDTLLYFYAYYKKATSDADSMQITSTPVKGKSGEELVNAFKANALFQAESVTKEEAKRKYILLAYKYIDF